MLEHIHKENWKNLTVLTGTAEHIPEAVLALLSEDKTTFEAAYWKIDNYSVVQGDLYTSAEVLPKYLCEVVLKSNFKERVIDLIWQIGSGYSEDAELRKRCYAESVRAYDRLLAHPEIKSTKYYEIIQKELDELHEIESNRK